MADKIRVATASLCGCFGCHMSLLDIDERIIDLVQLVEFDRSPINDIKTVGDCDIGLVEGGCGNEETVHTLRDFRRNCDVLIAVGQCAVMGGLPVMRNAIMHAEDPLRECLETAYLNSDTVYNPSNRIPNDEALPLMLDKVYTLADVVKVDYQIPGCPPSGETLWRTLQALLAGAPGDLPYELIKYD